MKKLYASRYSALRKKLPKRILPKSCLLFLLSLGITFNGFAQQQYQRVYANSETHSDKQVLIVLTLSEVQNSSNAIDGNVQTASTLRANVGALSLIQAWQNLRFTGPDLPTPSTPVTVKLGLGASVLNVLGGITVQATLNGAPVGTPLDSANLVGLLSAENQGEITFTPGVNYDGVRVTVEPTLGVGVAANLFHAYFLKPATGPVCSTIPLDVLSGTGKYLKTVDLANFSGHVSDPFNAIDGDENTFATLHADLGVAAYTQETVIFSSPSRTGDSVRLIVSKPGGLLELDVLKQAIQVETFNGATSVDKLEGGSSLLFLRLLSGPGNKVEISFASSGIFDRVQLRLGGVVSALSDLNLYEAQMVAPLPIVNIDGVQADTATICMDSSVVLEVANPETGTTYSWWSAATGGTKLGTGTSYTVPSGQALGTYKYYVQALRNGCTTATDRKEVAINVVEAASPTIIQPTADTTICLGQTVTLVASSAQNGATFNWYTTATGGTPIFTSKDTIQVTPTDTTTYYAETVLGSCASATRTGVTVNVASSPATPQVVPDTAYVTIGQTATFRVANADKTLDYNWYTASTGGTPIHTDSVFTTPVINADTKYYVDASRPSGCISPRTTVVVIALPAPTNVPCNTANQQQSPIFTGGFLHLCALCNVLDPGNAIDGDITTASNIRMNVGLGLGSSYIGQLVKFQHPGKAGDSIKLILGLPGGLADAQLLGNVRIETYQGSTPSGNPIFLNSSLLRLTLLGGDKFEAVVPVGADYDGVLVSIGGTLTALTTLNLYNAEQLIPLPSVSLDTLSICPGNKITLQASAPTGETILWYDALTGGNQLATGDTYTTPALSDTTVYYVTAMRDGCINPERIPVVVNVGATLTAPQVVPDTAYVTIGQTATFHVANADKTLDYNWYTASTGGTLIHTDSVFTTPAINADTAFYVEASRSGGCVSTRTRVVVIAQPAPTNVPCNTANQQQSPIFTGGFLHLCALCNVLDPENAIDGDITTASNIRMNVGLGLGSSYIGQLVKFQHTGKAGDSIRLIFGLPDGLADAQLLGNVRIETYNGNTPSGNPVFLNNSLLRLTLLSGNKFQAVVPATSDYDGVLVSIGGTLTALTTLNLYNAEQLIPLPIVTPDTLSVCPGNTVTLQATAPTGETILWYDAPVGGNQLTTGDTYTTPALSDTTVYYVTAMRDGCINPDRIPVLVNVGAPEPPTVVNDNVSVCIGGNATLQIDDPQTGIKYVWYTKATGGISLDTTTSFTVNSVTKDTAYYVAAVNGNDCISTTRTKVTIVATNTVPVPELITDTIYATIGQSVTFEIADPDPANFSYRWYDVQTGGSSIHDGTTFTTQVFTSVGNYVYYVDAKATSGCVSAARVKAVAIITAPPVNPNCTFANTQISPVYRGGLLNLCVLCGVTDPNNAIDADINTASNIRANVGLLGYIGQLVYFQHTGQAGDSIRLIMELPTGLADVDLLGHIRLETYNGNTPSGNPLFLNSALLHLRLLNGNKFSVTLPVVSGPYNGILVSIGGTLNALETLNLYAAQQLTALPEITSDTITICSGNTAKLTVTPATGTTVKWYNQPVGGAPLTTGSTFTTPVLTDTTTYYVTAARNGCENPNRKAITVAVGAPEAPELVSGNVEICPGSEATLQIKDPQTGFEYVWYDAENGGNELARATSFTTPSLTSTTSYWVAAIGDGGCVSATRTKATAEVTATVDAPDLLADTIYATTGQAITFEIAHADEANFTYRWYDVQTDGSSIHEGATFTTQVFTSAGTHIYYVDAQANGGCVSDTRTKAVAIITLPTNPDCNVANKQLSPIKTGLCLVCGVKDPNNAIDGDASTASNIRASVNVVGSVGQLLQFRHQGMAGDSIQLILGSNSGLLDASVLGGISVQFYQDENPVTQVIPINDALLRLILLQGTRKSYLTIVAPNDYNGVLVSIGGAVTALTSLYVYQMAQIIPLPTIDANNVTICNGKSATLSATPVSGTTVVWYKTSTGGTPVHQGNTFTTPALTDTTTYYVSAMRDGCTNPNRLPVIVNVRPSAGPTDIIVNAPNTICAGESATLQASSKTITNPIFTWYTDAQLTNKVFTGTSYTVNPSQTTTYYVTVQGTDVCENAPGDAQSVKITVDPRATAGDITVDGDGTICKGESATLQASSTTVTNPVFTWYSDAQLTNKVFAGASYQVSPSQTTTYYVTVQGTDVCENAPGNAQSVKVTVNPKATASDITVDGSGMICEGESATLQASSTTVTNPVFTWYTDAQLTNKVFTGTSYRVNPSQTTTYYVTVQGTGVCENAPGDAQSVKVTVNPAATASDITVAGGGAVCAGESLTLQASSATVTNPIFTWYTDAQLTKEVFTGASYQVSPSQTTTYYVTVQGASVCENAPGDAQSVKVTVNQAATASDITIAGGGTICTGESATLQASSSTVTNPIFTWYSDAQLKNKVFTGTDYTVTPSATTTYYVTVQGTGSCENAPGDAKTVKVTVNPSATASDITVDGGGTVCAGESVTLRASSTTVTNPVFTWYTDAQLTKEVFTGTSYQVSPSQTTTYYVTVQGTGVCENAPGDAQSVKVTVNPSATASDITITGGGAVCTGESVTLQASSTTVTNPIFTWYSDAQLKNKVFTGADYTVTPSATTTYYVTVQGAGVCENAAGDAQTVKITVDPKATASDITIDGGGTICEGESATLQASSTTVTNPIFTWYTDAQLANKVFTGTSYQASPSQTTAYYVTVQGTGVCENAPGDAESVKVTVNPAATASDITVKGGGAVCADESVTLQASSATVTNPIFTWYSDAQLKNKVFTGSDYTVTPSATTTYYVTVQGTDACENAAGDAKAVKVTVNPKAQASDIIVTGGGAVCVGESLTLTASSKTITNPVFTWYSDAQLKNKVFTGTDYTVTPSASTTYYVTVQGTGVCENAAGDAQSVTVTTNPSPVKPEVKGPPSAICGGGKATLEITNAQTGVTYNWYTSDKGGTVVHTGTTFTTKVLQTTTTYYVEAINAGGCSNTGGRTTVTVTVNPVPQPPAVEVGDVTVCTGNAATFKIKAPDADLTYKWYSVATGGASVASGANFTTPALQADATYYVEAVGAGGCTSSTRIMVTAKVVGPPAAPTVNISANPICPGTSATLTASSATAGVIFNWYDSKTGGDLVFTGSEFKTPELDAATTYYVEAVNAGGCTNTGGRTEITVQVLKQLPAPQVRVASTTAQSITFEWDPVTGATGYEVSTDKGATWQQPSSGTTGTTHEIKGVGVSQSVTLVVHALGQSSCQNSDPSEAVTGTTKNPLGNNFFVPNAFTPNSDGLNDVWLIYGNTINTLHVTVWNQYGQKVFESRSQQDGWDGSFNGKMQPVGVYVYYLEVTFQDGKSATKEGSINLIR